MPGAQAIRIDGRSLSLEDVEAIARRGARVELEPSAVAAIEATYHLNQRIVSAGTTVYGVTTGVGDSVGRKVASGGANHLQESLIRLNGAGTGPELPEDQARAVVVARANCLARGNSAVRPLIPEMMLQLLNLGYAPAIPEQGSIGASGDLVPSSYIGAVLMGEREVLRRGQRSPAAAVWEEAGREPVRLHAKEGQSLPAPLAHDADHVAVQIGPFQRHLCDLKSPQSRVDHQPEHRHITSVLELLPFAGLEEPT